MPAVADPGSSVVRAAHDLGIEVRPLVGPVSMLLALAASGLNGQSFAFVGYLPQEASRRATRLRELEAWAQQSGQSQMFIETPYRNAALLQALLQQLRPDTRRAVCSGLTLAQQRCTSLRVAEQVCELEQQLGKPVLSSNHAMAWHALRLAGVQDKLPAYGKLFEI